MHLADQKDFPSNPEEQNSPATQPSTNGSPDKTVKEEPPRAEEDYTEFTKRRVNEMFRDNPKSILDKEQVSQQLLREWQSRKQMTPIPAKIETGICQQQMAPENIDIEWRPELGKPKKWIHPYLWFVKMRKRELMQARPDMSFKDMMGHVSQTWKELPESEKQIYEKLSVNDKVRHDKQMAEFQEYI